MKEEVKVKFKDDLEFMYIFDISVYTCFFKFANVNTLLYSIFFKYTSPFPSITLKKDLSKIHECHILQIFAQEVCSQGLCNTRFKQRGVKFFNPYEIRITNLFVIYEKFFKLMGAT